MDHVPGEGGGQETDLTIVIKQFIIHSILEEDPDSCLECSQEFHHHNIPLEMVSALELMLAHFGHRGRPYDAHHPAGEPDEAGGGSGAPQQLQGAQEFMIRLIEM